jgi:hypothetical protein
MGGPRLSREEAEASNARYQGRYHGNGGIRKSYAALGDDTTLSRFVKVAGEPRARREKGDQMWLPDLRNKALEEGRTIFNVKGVKPVSEVKNVLVSGHSNVKIGRDVRAGLFRGYWIYTLTIEERKTCPRSCLHWQDCYGNNMPWAKRVAHGPELLDAIERELVVLLAKHPGILIRLHALGDFYAVTYVRFWRRMLLLHDRLAIYGYTARDREDDPIGQTLADLKDEFGPRFAMRWSNGGGDRDCTVSIEEEADCPPKAFICPEQTGKRACCATCGACWSSPTNVAFLNH